MLRQIPKPEISPDFTMEDIRKIRDWHYEVLKNATREERQDFYKRGSQNYEKCIAELRGDKECITQRN